MREDKKIRLGIFTVIIILLVGCSQKSIIEMQGNSKLTPTDPTDTYSDDPSVEKKYFHYYV